MISISKPIDNERISTSCQLIKIMRPLNFPKTLRQKVTFAHRNTMLLIHKHFETFGLKFNLTTNFDKSDQITLSLEV